MTETYLFSNRFKNVKGIELSLVRTRFNISVQTKQKLSLSFKTKSKLTQNLVWT